MHSLDSLRTKKKKKKQFYSNIYTDISGVENKNDK